MPYDSSGSATPGFKLTINGQLASDEVYSAISRVFVQYALNQPTMFSFDYNMFDQEAGTWQGIDLDQFKLGNAIDLCMGLDEVKPMMKGTITAIEPIFNENYSYVTIRGYDPLYLMRFGTRLHTYTNTTDSSIVNYLAKQAGLKASVNAPATQYPYLLQNNQSDYDFLMERANRIGYEISFEEETLHFQNTQEGKSPIAKLTYGIELDSFSATLRALTKGSTVSVRGWDQKNKQAFTSSAKTGSEVSLMGGTTNGYSATTSKLPDSMINIPASSATSPDDAMNIAKGVYNRQLSRFLEGQGTSPGMPAIRSGKNIDLAGLGSQFSGTYYVSEATHMYDNNGYITHFNVKRTSV